MAAHAMRRADDRELMAEARHEPERRERRVPDPVGHAQLLDARAHQVRARRGEPADERQRDDRAEAQGGREADLERAGWNSVQSADPQRPGRVADERGVDPQREAEADREHPHRQRQQQQSGERDA